MTTPVKVDLFKENKAEYASPRKPTIVTIRKAKYLAVEGRGAPGSDEFTAKVGALYGVVYTIKMSRKAVGDPEFVVCKLEAQYWLDGNADSDWATIPRDDWNWKLMIRVPSFVRAGELKTAIKALIEKGKELEVREVELESLLEGRCVQMLHLGPYENEPESIAQLLAFAEEQGYCFSGRHHEIYISDPRRVAPDRLKTILRMPIQRK